MEDSPDFILDDSSKALFIQSLPDSLSLIQANWNSLSREKWQTYKVEQLYEKIQEMNSNAALYDLQELHEAALSIDVYISSFVETGREPNQPQMVEIENLIKHLAPVVNNTVESEQQDAPLKKINRTIYCLQKDADSLDGLGEMLSERGYLVKNFQDPDDLANAVSTVTPAIIICDTSRLTTITPLKNELQRLKSQHNTRIPVVFVSHNDDLQIRITAMRAGAELYFAPPLDFRQIADEINKLANPKHATQHKVLVIEDDPPQAEFAASILKKVGMQTQTVTHPLHVMEALKQFKPDVILMDIYMPDANGLELTTIIRDDLRYMAIPIIFLSGEQDVDKQVHALSMGADDFVIKPIRPKHLIAIVNNRIQRTRDLIRAITLRFACSEADLDAESESRESSIEIELLENPDSTQLTTQSTVTETLSEETEADPVATIAKNIEIALATEGFENFYHPMLSLNDRDTEHYSLLLTLPYHDLQLDWDDMLLAAKQYQLEQKLDKWAIEQAIDSLDQIRKQGRHANLFVRQTVSCLPNKDQPDWIMARLRSRQLVGTGLVFEFNLKELAHDLKAAKNYFDALSKMGIQICLSNFPAKKVAFKLIPFLGIDYIKISDHFLQSDNSLINSFVNQTHKQSAKICVSGITDPRHINLHWTSVADLIQGDFISPPARNMDFDFSQSTL